MHKYSHRTSIPGFPLIPILRMGLRPFLGMGLDSYKMSISCIFEPSVPQVRNEWLEVLPVQVLGFKNYIILKLSIHLPSTIRLDLVGGFNPFQKILVKLEHHLNFQGENQKKMFETANWRCFLLNPPRFLNDCPRALLRFCQALAKRAKSWSHVFLKARLTRAPA